MFNFMHFNDFFFQIQIKIMSILFYNKHNDNCMVVQYCYLLNNKVIKYSFKL